MRTRLPALALAVVVGCASTTFDVLSRHDENFDFKGKRTYQWLPIPANRRLPTTVADYESSDRTIRKAFDLELQDRGFKASDNPDYRITYWVQVQDRITAGDYADVYGSTGGWDPNWYSDRYKKGGLVLDVIDAASNDLVWRGAALADFRPGKGEKILDAAIVRILDEFPDN